MGSEVVVLVGALDSSRAEDFEFGCFPDIVAYEYTANSIIKKLFLNCKDILCELQMVCNHAKSFLINMYMQLLLQVCLVTVVAFGSEGVYSVGFLDYPIDKVFWFALPLYKGQDMVDVVG